MSPTRSGAWGSPLRSRYFLRFASATFAVLLVVLPVGARNNSNRLCFPSTIWLGGGTPDITKPVTSDPGWNGGFRYVFGNGGITPDVVVQGIRDTSFFYISIEAHNMQTWDGSNVVELAFDPDGNAAHMQRIVIYPIKDNVNQTVEQAVPGTVKEVDYSQDSSQWNQNNFTVGVDPGWIFPSNVLAAYTCEKDNNNNCQTNGRSWTLAIKLPITTAPPNATQSLTNALTAPTSGLFGFYVDVVRVVDEAGDAQQSFWPNDDPTHQGLSGCSLSLLCTPNTLTPDPNYWGFSTQDTTQSCKGVSLGYQTQDISTNHTIDGLPEISLNANNNFFANVYNTSVDGSGNAISAQQVFTTFRIANFGLPSQWTLVPTVNSSWNISSITRSSNNVIVNTTSPIPFGAGDVGDRVTIAGVADSSFNGTFPITWNSTNTSTQITYTQAGSNSTSSGGTVAYDSHADGQNSTSVVDGNPTSPHDINPNSSFTFTTDPWRLTSSQQTDYQTHHVWSNGLGEQCIQVKLDSAPTSNTVILNSQAVQNMYFGTASKFKAAAEISAKGYPERKCDQAPCPADQLFELQVSSSVSKSSRNCVTGESQGRGAATEQVDVPSEVKCSQIIHVIRGCRHTGAYMTVGKKKLNLCDGVGAFGFVVQHTGDVGTWNSTLSGPQLQEVGPGRYQIHVPQNGVTTVTTQIEPEYAGEEKVAVFADFGAAIPQGAFGNAYNKGFSLNAGLEYMVNPRVSAEGIFGYHHFPSNLLASENVYQFSGNVKVYLSKTWPVQPFFNAGVGGYKFSSGDTYFGGNFGFGVLKKFSNPHWGIQGSYNFHTVKTPTTSKFSTVQGGIRYVF